MQVTNKHIITKDEVVAVAQEKRDKGIMLGMIHGFIDKEGKNIITYDYFEGENVESYEVQDATVLPTISGIYASAAEWPEREINELMGVEFEGLDVSKRLFLPENMVEGKGQIFVTPISELKEKNPGMLD